MVSIRDGEGKIRLWWSGQYQNCKYCPDCLNGCGECLKELVERIW